MDGLAPATELFRWAWKGGVVNVAFHPYLLRTRRKGAGHGKDKANEENHSDGIVKPSLAIDIVHFNASVSEITYDTFHRGIFGQQRLPCSKPN